MRSVVLVLVLPTRGMSNFTNVPKNTTSWSTATENSPIAISAGTPIGLLLALTYGGEGVSRWTRQSKNTASFTNQTKN